MDPLGIGVVAAAMSEPSHLSIFHRRGRRGRVLAAPWPGALPPGLLPVGVVLPGSGAVRGFLPCPAHPPGSNPS